MSRVKVPDLIAENIEVVYHKGSNFFTALEKVSLTFSPDELTCLIGPSGAGKSTLLKSLVGIAPLISGKVTLDSDILALCHDGPGHDFSLSRRRARQRTGWMAQDLCLSFNLTALQNVCCGTLYSTHPFKTLLTGFSDTIRDQAYQALCELGLADKVHEKVKRLSGGQRQRVALARALMQDSWWLLVDEPVSALDEGFQQTALTQILDFKNRGRGLIMVIHDLEVALKVADRLIGFRDGAIVFDGSPAVFSNQIRQKLFVN